MQFGRATHQVSMRNRPAAVDVSDTEISAELGADEGPARQGHEVGVRVQRRDHAPGELSETPA